MMYTESFVFLLNWKKFTTIYCFVTLLLQTGLFSLIIVLELQKLEDILKTINLDKKERLFNVLFAEKPF